MQLLLGSTAAALPARPEHAPQEALLRETTGAISSLARLDRSVMPGSKDGQEHQHHQKRNRLQVGL